MATAWPFSGTPRKWDVLASGPIPAGLWTWQTQSLYIQKLRIVNTDPAAIITLDVNNAAGDQIILDTYPIGPKGIYPEVMDLAPYVGLRTEPSATGLVWIVFGWKGTGTI